MTSGADPGASTFEWRSAEVSSALGVPVVEEGRTFRGISTDTRTLEVGDLFVALRGENFDGHDFLDDARRRGAAGFVVDREPPEVGDAPPAYVVSDTLVALGLLARHRRRVLGWTVVGVSGSAGKTTAKDLIRAALSSTFRVHATRANRNNRVGVPLTLLEAPAASEVLVVEMGTNEPGEIALLTEIAEPDLAVLTTVGDAHLEGLESREGIFREKLALLSGMAPRAWAVVGDDPAELPARAREVLPGVAVAGLSEAADPEHRAEAVEFGPEGRARFRWRGRPVRPRIPGTSGVRNALFALAVSDRLRVPAGAAIAGIESVAPPPLRGEIRRFGGLRVIVDCYNANPQSVRAALDLLVGLSAPAGRVAVLGSMLELGSRSAELHEEVLAGALDPRIRLIVLVGEEFRRVLEATPSGARVESPTILAAPSAAEAWPLLEQELTGEEVVLLKGSRGLALERLLDPLERSFGGAGEASEAREG